MGKEKPGARQPNRTPGRNNNQPTFIMTGRTAFWLHKFVRPICESSSGASLKFALFAHCCLCASNWYRSYYHERLDCSLRVTSGGLREIATEGVALRGAGRDGSHTPGQRQSVCTVSEPTLSARKARAVRGRTLDLVRSERIWLRRYSGHGRAHDKWRAAKCARERFRQPGNIGWFLKALTPPDSAESPRLPDG